MIQRLAWPLQKDDMQIHEAFHIKKKNAEEPCRGREKDVQRL